MKWILIVAMLLAMAARGQDAATEERLNKLEGYVKDLLAAQADTQKRIASLAKELETVRDQNKAGGVLATQDDLKRLDNYIKEVDRKRLDDYEKIHQEIEKLVKAVSAPVAGSKTVSGSRGKDNDVKPNGGGLPAAYFKHIVQKDENLSIIIEAYRAKGIKVTQDEIVKANDGLNPNLLRIGQELIIPAPEK